MCYCYSEGGSGVVQPAVFSHTIAFNESQAERLPEEIQTRQPSHRVFSFVALRRLVSIWNPPNLQLSGETCRNS